MRIGCSARRAPWLLAAMLVVGASSWAQNVSEAQAEVRQVNVPLGDVGMELGEFEDFQRQAPADQRRRLDMILASHPDAVGARFLRLQADVDLRDFATMISDSEVLLAAPSMDRRLREPVLLWRAEALIQFRRFDEAIAVASGALDIDADSADALFARGWARLGALPPGPRAGGQRLGGSGARLAAHTR